MVEGASFSVVREKPAGGEESLDLSGMIAEAMANTTGGLAAFAEELGVSYHTIWSWRAGRRTPDREWIHRLADAFERRGGELQGLASQLRETAGRP